MAFSLFQPRTITLSHLCTLPPSQARARIEAVAKALCADISLKWLWLNQTRLRFLGSGLSDGVGGFITLTGKSLDITLTLPGHLACLEPKIRAQIEATLAQHLPPTSR